MLEMLIYAGYNDLRCSYGWKYPYRLWLQWFKVFLWLKIPLNALVTMFQCVLRVESAPTGSGYNVSMCS